MTEQLLLHYTRLVEFLGHVLGPDYEIILHEILPEQSRVAAIANGGISGRDVGAPITNAALRMIMQKQYESNNYIINYTGQLSNGKTLRSSCFPDTSLINTYQPITIIIIICTSYHEIIISIHNR